ncbi:HD domain-containing protein [Clostridium chromiireducens]|uniref:HD domain-containing protein n=1 Tax=Clostridium chromiireducens TaxID=225345 RepID=A0A964W3S3_9CLOT|nr:HD domain-containing protein [Clostridium chromiireducens]
MDEIKINLVDSMLGNVLSRDVISRKGLKIAEKDTIINNFIKYELIKVDIQSIWIYDVSEFEQSYVEEGDYNKIKVCYEECIISLKEIFQDLAQEKTLKISKLNHVAKLVYENINNIDCIIKYIREIRKYEYYEIYHSINVSFYAMFIGKWLGMHSSEILDLIIAGLLHDIGKLRIPGHILNKKEKLTAEEFKIIKRHTTLGYSMLKNEINLNYDIKKSILMHHERLDGSGYPNGVTGDYIGEYAKIISIADIYDAMTTNRVYKNKINPFEAFQIFLKTGMNLLELSKVNVFILNLSSHLLGVKLKLINGEKFTKDLMVYMTRR